MMRALEKIYQEHAGTPSEISEHLPTLKEYAAQAQTVVELGTWCGKSTSALLMGTPGHVYSYDVQYLPQLTELAVASKGRWTFRLSDSRDPSVPACDFMFIDSYHTGRHLESELDAHADKVKVRIAMHDTVTYGTVAEDGSEGLMLALMRWLGRHPEWVIAKHFENNNGLTVLERA